MYIHIGYLKHQVTLRKHMPKFQDDIGSIIKHQRKSMNLTLEESAEGICSVSYLSKIENNQLMPSEKYIELFQEKFNVDLKRIVPKPNEELLEDLIDLLFYKEKDNLNERNFIGMDYHTKLYRFAYYVIHKDYKEAKKTYYSINPYMKNLTDLELHFYLYLSAYLLKEEGRINDAFKVLNLFKKKCYHYKLNMLIETEKIILACSMNKYLYVSLNYDRVLNNLVNHEVYHLAHEIKYIYLAYMSQFLSLEMLNEALDKTVHINEDEKNYVLATYLYLSMNYDQAFKLIEIYAYKQPSYYLLTLMILNKIGDASIINMYLEKEMDTNNAQEFLIIKYLQEKYLIKKQETVGFIRDHVIKLNDLSDRRLELLFWYEEGIEEFKKLGFYKDATYFGQMIFSKINDLASLRD